MESQQHPLIKAPNSILINGERYELDAATNDAPIPFGRIAFTDATGRIGFTVELSVEQAWYVAGAIMEEASRIEGEYRKQPETEAND